MRSCTVTVNKNNNNTLKAKDFVYCNQHLRKVVGASSSRHCNMGQTLFGAGAYNLQSISALRRIGSGSRD